MSRSSVTDGIVRGHRGHHALAGCAPVVVLVVGVTVRDAAVDDHQRQLVGQRAPARHSVERQSKSRALAVDAAGRGELVHQPAHHADVVVLGVLRDLRHLQRAARPDRRAPTSAQAVTTSSAADDDSPEPMGRVLDEQAVEAAHGLAVLGQGPGRAGDVVVPGITPGREGVEADGRGLAVVVASDADARLVGRQQRDAHVHVDGEGQHEAAVVVGVLADEVDAPRSAHDHDLVLAAGGLRDRRQRGARRAGRRRGWLVWSRPDGRRRLALSHGLLVGSGRRESSLRSSSPATARGPVAAECCRRPGAIAAGCARARRSPPRPRPAQRPEPRPAPPRSGPGTPAEPLPEPDFIVGDWELRKVPWKRAAPQRRRRRSSRDGRAAGRQEACPCGRWAAVAGWSTTPPSSPSRA